MGVSLSPNAWGPHSLHSPFPFPPNPLLSQNQEPPSPSFHFYPPPLEVGPLKSSQGVQGSAVNRIWYIFLPCDAMRCTVFVIVIILSAVRVSVRPSVCHTLAYCVHMVRHTIMISSPYGSPMILVSGDVTFIPKFEGGSPRSESVE